MIDKAREYRDKRTDKAIAQVVDVAKRYYILTHDHPLYELDKTQGEVLGVTDYVIDGDTAFIEVSTRLPENEKCWEINATLFAELKEELRIRITRGNNG